MVRMTQQSQMRVRPELGESWVVESEVDENEEATSDIQDNGPEITEILSQTVSPDGQLTSSYDIKRTASHIASSPMASASSASSEIPRRRSSRKAFKAIVEPEFIMPSIYEGGLSRSQTPSQKRPVTKSRGQMSQAKNGHRSTEAGSNVTQERLLRTSEGIESILRPILGYMVDILGGVLRALKTPISYAISIYLLFGLAILLRNLLTSTVYSALSPICRLPGSSILQLPMCKAPSLVNYKGEQTPPVEFDQLMKVQYKFEQIMEETAGGISLPFDMKRSEASIRDLRQVVRYSQLHSKNELVLEFDGFVETARMASYDLGRFNSHVGRAVDKILSTAHWTQRMLDGIAASDESRGAVNSFVIDKLLAPFQPLKFTEDKLLDQYIQHTRYVEEEISRLLGEAQSLLLTLQNLEDRLDVIHGISEKDNSSVKGSRDEVLTKLWSKLGGNSKQLGRYQTELDLLEKVGQYRRLAWAHVAGTVLKLQAMGSELEGLRERVGSADLLRDRAHIPLSVHIRNIQLGVERLEAGRAHARQVENDYKIRLSDRAGEADEVRQVREGKLVEIS